MGAEVLLSQHFSILVNPLGLTANVYVDGFNVYYCAVRYTAYKWLDLHLLCRNLFPLITIKEIKYFSAKVKPVPWDLSAPTRQTFYWRALETIPNLKIIRGTFVSRTRYLPRVPFVYKADGRPQKVGVLRTEEKGSDVSLAAHLVHDSCIRTADESIVISNDSDLVNAIEIVTVGLGRPVTVVNPNRTSLIQTNPKGCRMPKELQRVATQRVLSIDDQILAASQFPPVLTDKRGTFHKPAAW